MNQPLIIAVTMLSAVTMAACTPWQTLHSQAAYPISDSPHIQSWSSLQRERVVMQKFDYSCGAAAMATLLHYYFDESVTELDVLADIDELFSDEATFVIQDEGLSFKELEELAQHRGYQAASVQLTPEAARTLQGPIIIYLKTPNYRHFAVLRQVIGDTAYVADPSLGNVELPFSRLLQDWHGESLVLGKTGFGVPDDFPLRPNIVQTTGHGTGIGVWRQTGSDWSRLPR